MFNASKLILIAIVALALSGCDSCQSEPETPKVIETTPDVSVEDEPEDPLKEARENAEKSGEDIAIALNDSARNTAAAMEALANKPKPPTKPRIREEAETGKVDVAAVKRVFNQNNGAMRKCYERALKKSPGLEGKLTLEVKIKGDGSVAWAKARAKSLNNASVFDCMERQAKTMKFPKPKGGAVRVNNPYTFTPDI